MISTFLRLGTLVLAAGLTLVLLAACAEPPTQRVELTILATADVHGRVMSWDYLRDEPDEAHGLLKAASLIQRIRRERDHVLLLDAGDFLQGNPFADYFATLPAPVTQHPVLHVMDALDYDAIVLGNHEFNFGVPYIDAQVDLTSTPVLAGNVYHHGTDTPAYTPYILRELGGVRVGVLGLTTPGSAVWDRHHVEGRLDFGDGITAASRFVPKLREAGADIVVLLLHTGLESRAGQPGGPQGRLENFGRAVIESVPGVDVAILSHSHRVIDDLVLEGPQGRPVAVVQPGRWASHLGEVRLTLETTADAEGWQVQSLSSRALPLAGLDAEPGLMQRVEGWHEEVRAWVAETIATTPEAWDSREARLRDTPMVDLIQRVQTQAGDAQLSASAAFTTRLAFGPGPITRADLAALYPYENTLMVLEITGEQLRAYLEHAAGFYAGVEDGVPVVAEGWPGYNFDIVSGADYVIDLRRPLGDRIIRLEVDGAVVRDEDLFTLAVNSYRAQGAGGYTMLAEARLVAEIPRSVRSLIEEYLAERGELRQADVYRQNWSLVY